MLIAINPYFRSVSVDGDEVQQKVLPYPSYFDHLASVSCSVEEVIAENDVPLFKISSITGLYKYVSNFIRKEYYYRHLPDFIAWYKAEKIAQANKQQEEQKNTTTIVTSYVQPQVDYIKSQLDTDVITDIGYDSTTATIRIEKSNKQSYVILFNTATDEELGLVKGSDSVVGTVSVSPIGTMRISDWSNVTDYLGVKNTINTEYTTVVTAISANTVYTVPSYIVGNGSLVVFISGDIAFPGVDYTERGDALSVSTTIAFSSNISVGTKIVVLSVYDFFDDTIPLPAPTPIASAGIDQTIKEGDEVTLYGEAFGGVGTNYSYLWEQLSGIGVTLQNPDRALTTFVAPEVNTDTTVLFQLIVQDSVGTYSKPAVVGITIRDTTIDYAGINLVPNGSFTELGTGWTLPRGFSIAQYTAGGQTTEANLLVNSATPSRFDPLLDASKGITGFTDPFPYPKANTRHTISFTATSEKHGNSFQTPEGGYATCRVYARYLDSSGNQLGADILLQDIGMPEGWTDTGGSTVILGPTTYQNIGNAPAMTARMILLITFTSNVQSNAPGGDYSGWTVTFDDFKVTLP